MSTNPDAARQLLRHTVATVAYRGGKTLRGAPASFAEFQSSQGTRTPGQILAHIGDLVDWAHSMASGDQSWHDSKPLAWDAEAARFFASLKKFDDFLASSEPLLAPIERLFQGPIADALTHVGQLAMLRRLAGCPIKGENYFKAEIQAGRVGVDQASPTREF
ncbi:MAG TPA: hypothetical protein VE077_10310 [Candidatus Methylomirabilis sp.]|nr:hypothetical protein [Candidatus Methylomirabilis sp.]